MGVVCGLSRLLQRRHFDSALHASSCQRPDYEFVVFFFQAEAGIRDIGVTGVQTCALPIFIAPNAAACAYKEMGKCAAPCDGSSSMEQYRQSVGSSARTLVDPAPFVREQNDRRSEERRVGKECRSRWSPYH